jgi:PKD repeat protein
MLTLFWHPQWAAGEAPSGSPPVADFSGTPTTGDTPLAVQFTDASTESPTSWLWDFGDSTTSTAQNPLKTYPAAGTFTVSLTATNADGSDTETKVDYITTTDPGPGPTPDAGGNDTTTRIAALYSASRIPFRPRR